MGFLGALFDVKYPRQNQLLPDDEPEPNIPSYRDTPSKEREKVVITFDYEEDDEDDGDIELQKTARTIEDVSLFDEEWLPSINPMHHSSRTYYLNI